MFIVLHKSEGPHSFRSNVRVGVATKNARSKVQGKHPLLKVCRILSGSGL
jgi:hypothetical protein